MNAKSKAGLAAILAAIFGTSTGPVNAQESTPATNTRTLEEVVVTAQKFESNLQSTPISIVAVTGAKLDELGVSDAQDMDAFIPNLQMDGATNSAGNSATFSIRGIGTYRSSPTSQNTVGVYVDDIYMPGFEAGALDLLDLDRVEVLRGPQGTLFGRNAIAGAIHYISKAPDTDSLYGRVKVAGGQYGRRSIDASANVPLSDQLAARFSVMDSSRDGYITSTFDGSEQGGSDSTGLRASFRYEASDNLSFDLIADHISSERHGSRTVATIDDNFIDRDLTGTWIGGGPSLGFRPWTDTGTGSFDMDSSSPGFGTITGLTSGQCEPLGMTAPCTFDLSSGEYSTIGGTHTGSEVDNTGVAFKANWDLSPSTTVRSITGWRTSEANSLQDADATPFHISHNVRNRDFESLSQELQILWSGERLSFVGGLYYYSEDQVETVNDSRFGDVPYDENCTLNFAAGTYSFNGCTQDEYTSTGGYVEVVTDLDSTSKAVYGNLTVPLNEVYELIIGGRYTDDKQSMVYTNSRNGFTTEGLGGTTFTEGVFTPRVVLNAQFNNDLLAYASYSKGYRQGGLNDRQDVDADGNPIPQLVPPFKSETNDAYEVGVKTDFWDGRGRLNAAYYLYDYDNLQTTAAPPGDTRGYDQNVAAAEISGLEADLTLMLTDNWTFNAGVGTTDAEYKSIGDGATQIALEAGLPRAPELSYTLGLIYDKETTAGLWKAAFTYGFTDEQFSTPQAYNNLPTQPSGSNPLNALCQEVIPSLNRTDGCKGNQGVLPDYGLLNARIQFTNIADTWTAGLYCRNCTDEYYLVGLSAFGQQVPLASVPSNKAEPGHPREFGIDFEYRFGGQ